MHENISLFFREIGVKIEIVRKPGFQVSRDH